MTQQEYIKDAMQQLGLRRQGLADLLGVSLSGLNHWLAPVDTAVFRPMPANVWKHIAAELELKRLRQLIDN